MDYNIFIGSVTHESLSRYSKFDSFVRGPKEIIESFDLLISQNKKTFTVYIFSNAILGIFLNTLETKSKTKTVIVISCK